MAVSKSIVRRKFPKKLLGVRLSALLEIVLFLAVATLFDVYYGKGDRYFGISPHPFTIIVILVSVQYGTIEGLLATLLSTVVMYAWNVPPEKVGETLFDYQFRLTLMPLIWFISSFVLGEVRMRQAHEKIMIVKLLDETQKKLDTISEEYTALKEAKENIESHLVSQHQRVTSTFKFLKDLETLKPAQVLMKLNRVIHGVINVNKFSVYALGENGLEIVTSEGWEENDAYSLRIVQDHPLFWQIYGEQRLVCIINENDEQIFRGEGVMAAPLVNPTTGEVFGMVKVEDIELTNLNISSIETFKNVCELIGMSYSNASQYQETRKNMLFYSDESSVFSNEMYHIQKDAFKALCEKGNFPLSQLAISTNKRLGREDEKGLIDAIVLTIKKHLPPITQYFYSQGRGEILIVLLPLCRISEAEQLSHTLLKTMVQSNNFGEMVFKFSSKTLFEENEKKKYAKES